MGNGGKRDAEHNARPSSDPKQMFLGALRICAAVAPACDAAGIGRTTAYRWRDEDPEFAAAWREALEAAIDDVERAGFMHAKKGNPSLITWLLRCHRPEKYNPPDKREHEVSGKGGGPIQAQVETRLTPDAIGEIVGILSDIGVLAPGGRPGPPDGTGNPPA